MTGLSLKLPVLSYSYEKCEAESSGNATQRVLRLRTDYMWDENVSSHRLPGTIDLWLMLGFSYCTFAQRATHE